MQSAESLRERRIAATSARLTTLARLWTVERGFTGFTIDELCAAVDVSRRTFFNWFASKEDAVLGVAVRIDHSGAETRFIEGADLTNVGMLSSTLLEDLAELMLARWEALGLDHADLAALAAAMDHAPRLLARTLQMTREQEQHDSALVEQREGLASGDLRASMVVHLLGTVLRAALEQTFRHPGEGTLRAVFAQRLAIARHLFTL